MFTLVVVAQSQTIQSWPQVITSGQDTIIIYQPQIESWKDNILKSRSAVQYLAPGKDPAFGIIDYSARTETDIPNNLVYLTDVQIQQSTFPSLPDNGTSLNTSIASKLNEQSQLSLDQVKSDLAINKEVQQQIIDVNNDPPKIIYSTSPAVLVLVDGDPALQPIGSSNYQRVINSSSFISYNSQKKNYNLSLFGYWYTAPSIQGPWTIDSQVDDPLNQIYQSAIQADTSIQDYNPPSSEIGILLSQGISPQIFVSTEPAELLISDGEPLYEPISGTNLLYVKNTNSDMFKFVGDGMTYVLVSGRWFRTNNVHQAWTFVPPDQLPSDFKNLPSDHPKGSALVSVPGTVQAQEALITNQIPQTATIDRQTASMQTTYDGTPDFQSINGTNMQYATNTSTPVVVVNNNYYAVDNGVWYNSASPYGPWAVAVTVPPVIYSIPPSCPIHYITYVRVYGYTPTMVYVGYTGGYYGCYLNRFGTVVYGTGWRYRPWIGRRWYGYPYSYGFGVNFNWNSWAGWSMSFGYGSSYYPVCKPWWGPVAYGPHRPRYIYNTQINVYRYNVHARVINRNFRQVNYYHNNRFNNGHHYFAGPDNRVYRRDPYGNWHVHQGNHWQSVQNHSMNNNYNNRQQGNHRVQMQQNYHNANHWNNGNGNQGNHSNNGNWNNGNGNNGNNGNHGNGNNGNGNGNQWNNGNNGNGNQGNQGNSNNGNNGNHGNGNNGNGNGNQWNNGNNGNGNQGNQGNSNNGNNGNHSNGNNGNGNSGNQGNQGNMNNWNRGNGNGGNGNWNNGNQNTQGGNHWNQNNYNNNHMYNRPANQNHYSNPYQGNRNSGGGNHGGGGGNRGGGNHSGGGHHR